MRAVNGHDLRHLRQRAGLTQAKLAEQLGLTSNHVARLERNERRITKSMERLVRLTLASTRAKRKSKGSD